MASAGKLVANRKRENRTITDDKRENLTDVPLGEITDVSN